MRRKLVAVAILMPALLGCVTETYRQDGSVIEEKTVSSGRTPIEIAEQQIQARIDRLKLEQGADLVMRMQEIASFRELALGPVAESLAGADARQRANLVYILGMIGGTEAHNLVAAQVRDRDSVVRYEAAASLLQFGDWSGVPVLMGFLEDSDRRMRFKAFQALKQFTKQDFGYDFAGEPEARTLATKRWNEWWQKRRAELVYR